MKRKLLFISLLLLGGLPAFCQPEYDKLQADFEKQSNDPNILYGRNKSIGKYYEFRGFKMYAEVYGEGQPVLIIHGNGGSISNFLYQIPYFSKGYKVIVADSRSQGRSFDN